MTNPPQGSDEPRESGWAEQDRHPTEPVPSFERPQQPAAPHGYGQPPQPWPGSQYARPGQGPVGGPAFAPPPYQGQGQPPYGYAPPPYGPVQKSRVGLIAAVTGVLLLLIAGAVVLALGLQSTVLDRTSVERDVAAQFEDREGVAIDLSCAEEMTVDAGSTYECTGTTADGEEVTLQIAITDEDSAAYTWTEP
jgi:hypothetical protein